MILLGKCEIDGETLYLAVRSYAIAKYYVLISPMHKDDRIKMITGEDPSHVVIKDKTALREYYDNEYVLGAIKKGTASGKVMSYGDVRLLNRVMDSIAYARSYHFRKDDIIEDNKDVRDGVECFSFGASDQNLSYNYEKRNGTFTFLRITTSQIKFDLSPVNYSKLSFTKLHFEPMQTTAAKSVQIATLKDINYNLLTEKLDMSWYKKDGVLQKNYQSIKSNREFELKIMTPMIKRILEKKKEGSVFDVSVDTETTGLKVYNLAPDNPDRDHCVAVPICWELNTSYVIYTDMEHFHNADNQYVAHRLAELFENFKGERTIEYYDECEEDVPNATASGSSATVEMNVFEDSYAKCSASSTDEIGAKGKSSSKLVKKSAIITRDLINLIGHNSPFDGRVFFSEGVKFYFNNNTLQMAFDLNPTSVRMSKALKSLTRRLFHHETPELSDILGKGNEDKYRYLADDEVARIYGCADADYTLAVFYVLRKLMTDKMYHWYQKQDIPMDNILYQSEYWGMPAIEDKLEKLTEESEKNLQILKDAMYSYVGVFVKYSQDVNVLKARWEAGQFNSREDYEEAVAAVVPDASAKYEFEFTPAQLRSVLYDVMKYPVKGWTDTHVPKLDKFVIKKLLGDKLKPGENAPRKLEEDILCYGVDRNEYDALKRKDPGSKKLKSMCLISADEFNKYKYPLALILQKYTELNKEYTSYFKPMKESNLEGKVFKGYNMARIETRRISNPGQTMKGSLKALIRSYGDDEYLLDFDMAQIEYRIMLSLSHFIPMIKKMCDPENDYHTETASMVEMKPAYRITKKERKSAKKVSFGVPYGLGDRSLCESIFGDTTKEHMAETRVILHKWRQNNKPIVDLLEKARAEAFVEWKISEDFRNFIDAWKRDPNTKEYLLDENGNKIPSPISKVENILGFYRTFSLENIDLSPAGYARRANGEYTSEESSIRRKAGNYQIQATAAEIFRIILIRFYEECEKYGIQDKVKWYMLIHDELLCSVKNDINPILIYKIVKKACMITMKGHTKYFVGINMGDTWGECKDDAREAPIYFVERMIKRYDAGEFREQSTFPHPWEFIQPYRKQYVEDRIGEVIKQLQPSFPEKPLVISDLLDQFTNYTVRAYVDDYPMNGDISYKATKGESYEEALEADLKWVKRLESWAISKYGEGVKFIDINGNTYEVTKFIESKNDDHADEDFIDYSELFDDETHDAESYWSYNNDSAGILYEEESEDQSEMDNSYDEYLFEYDFESGGKDVTSITVTETTYKHIKVLNHQIIVSLDVAGHIDSVKSFLKAHVAPYGNRVVFRIGDTSEHWGRIKETTDLKTLDCFIEFLCSENKVLIDSKTMYVKVNSRIESKQIVNALKRYTGSDYTIVFCSKIGKPVDPYKFSSRVSLAKLEKFINSLERC